MQLHVSIKVDPPPQYYPVSFLFSKVKLFPPAVYKFDMMTQTLPHKLKLTPAALLQMVHMQHSFTTLHEIVTSKLFSILLINIYGHKL